MLDRKLLPLYALASPLDARLAEHIWLFIERAAVVSCMVATQKPNGSTRSDGAAGRS